MSDQNLTDWYQPDQKPVRIGPYEVNSGEPYIRFQFWNGKFWGMLSGTIAECIDNRDFVSILQSLPWRGLSEDPSAGYITVRIPRPVDVSDPVFRSTVVRFSSSAIARESILLIRAAMGVK